MIKKDIFDKDIGKMFRASAKDRLYRFIMADNKIRGAIVHATRMVNEMRANHELGPLETLVLGQSYVAGALLGSGLKGEKDRLCISVECSGPVRGLDVEVNGCGEIRGCLKAGRIALSSPEKVRSLSALYGAGFLTITKYLEDSAAPYSGRVVLEYGSLAEDLACYFLKSEQIPTGIRLNIFFDENNIVRGAGGILVQALPGADPDMVAKAEKMLADMKPPGELFADGHRPDRVVAEAFSGLEPQILSDTRVEFFCRCSKDGMGLHLRALPAKDREELVKNGPFPLEIRCHNCSSVYCFTRQELELLFT